MKRYANIRLLAAVALLVATAGCKDDEGPALKQPALLSIQDAAADAEVITVESPKKQTLNIRVEAEQQHDGKIFFQNVHRFVRF